MRLMPMLWSTVSAWSVRLAGQFRIVPRAYTAAARTSGTGSLSRVASLSWALSRMPHQRAAVYPFQVRPRQRASHWRRCPFGSVSCSVHSAITLPLSAASCPLG
uniref:Secreted protein n=1 Tax=Ixodes ricinus TaxID=34613 RepID=A0A6B0UAP3_IXORI